MKISRSIVAVHDPSKRNFLKVGGAGLGSVALTGGLAGLLLTQTACSTKDVAFYVSTIVGALGELKPLLPGAAGTIAKAVTVANDFLAAYRAGKLVNAKTALKNLVDLLIQIGGDIGIGGNPTAKVIFALASVAIHTIAALIMTNTPAVAMAGVTSAEQAMVERMANPATLHAIFVASAP